MANTKRTKGPDAFSERDLVDLFELSEHTESEQQELNSSRCSNHGFLFPSVGNAPRIYAPKPVYPTSSFSREEEVIDVDMEEEDEDPLMRKVWSPERSEQQYFDSNKARRHLDAIVAPTIAEPHVIPSNTAPFSNTGICNAPYNLTNTGISGNNASSYYHDALDRADTHCVFQARHHRVVVGPSVVNNNTSCFDEQRVPFECKKYDMDGFIKKPTAHRRFGSFSSSSLDDLNLVTSESKIVMDHQQEKQACSSSYNFDKINKFNTTTSTSTHAPSINNLMDAFAFETKKRKRSMEENGGGHYVEPRDEDVLLGRGGRANKHPGNERYHNEKVKLQPAYKAATKEDKTDISQDLVDVINGYGGRFLKFDESAQQWYEVANIVARRKASQALREENTPEKRAAKRAKYPAKSRAKGARQPLSTN